MKKSVKRLLSFVLTFCLVITGTLAFSVSEVEAKAAPKLSAKSTMLAMGGSRKITLSNGSGKWSIKENGVVKITKMTKTYVKVKPIKSGTTYVYCKSKGKELKCKVKVINDRIGNIKEEFGSAAIVGQSFSFDYTIPEGVSLKGTEYDSSIGKVKTKTSLDEDSGETTIKITIKALKPGRFPLVINYLNGGEPESEVVPFNFINGFRGKAKVKKTSANYKKWRKKTIATMVSSDMSTWEIIDAIGTLISSGEYGMKGGATGLQLWYGGNGTCVSGAKMMNDFMKDLGVSCKVHFAGDDVGTEDIYGYSVMYGIEHKNVRVTLGGKRYELNPQPGMMWPLGTVKR